MYILRALSLTLLLAGLSATPEQVSFPTQDGGIVYADMYGKGERGVVLVLGGRFNKESWAKQARTLVKAGFRVLAIGLWLGKKSMRPIAPCVHSRE